MTVENSWTLSPLNKKFLLGNDELHIWRTKISENTKYLNDYWSLLTQYEQIQAKSFYFIKDRNRYIVTRAILRKLLKGYLGSVQSKNILFEQTKYGKPYLHHSMNITNIKFNLSHSNDCIVYVFSKNIDVGIDIEYINKDLIIDDIVEHCCSNQEQIELQKLFNDNKYAYFYKLWVIKEALVKAMGLGLSFDLRQMHINFAENKLINAINVIDSSKLCWTLDMFSTYNGYYSAFAAKNPIKRVIFLTFEDESRGLI